MSEWPYLYCPHQAYNKNKMIRLTSISCSFMPDPTIDAFTNVNVKCANLNKYNIETLAYEKYFRPSKESSLDTNFAKDFYLETKNTDSIKFDNNLVNQEKEHMNK
jgi:hypothetical protein